jgi:hypothetical protein
MVEKTVTCELPRGIDPIDSLSIISYIYRTLARSSRGLGHWSLTPATRVRIPYALLITNKLQTVNSLSMWPGSHSGPPAVPPCRSDRYRKKNGLSSSRSPFFYARYSVPGISRLCRKECRS